MYSRQKSKSDRRRKGRVQVKNSNDRLQLVFSHPIISLSGEIETKRFYLSTGQADTPIGRQQAAVLAATIQRDIDYGELDVTLKKYQPGTPFPDDHFEVQTEIQLALDELWERYEQFKAPQVGQTTIAKTYRRIRNHIASLPSQKLRDAVKIRDYLLAQVTPDTAKRVLTYINACCEWGIRSKLIDSNPFQGMASEIKVPKSVSEEMDINPFTREERDQVILAFEESKLYYYYAPLVKFLFFTGCRPSEAIALQWRHIGDRSILFEQAITPSTRGFSLKKGLKTQSQRRFPINGQLKEILDSFKPDSPQGNGFIFRSKRGGVIDLGDFLNHAWKGYKNRHGKHIDGIVTSLVNQGLVSEYRYPYQCRHTFITLCLESNIPVKDVARWVGNSPEVIYRHYAGKERNLQVPEL